jgi:hypothetical protein
MKSKITIDVDWDNQPIIKIEYEDSPDVRDKLVKRFMEGFTGASCWASFYFDQSVEEMINKSGKRAKLRPIEPSKLWEHTEMFTETANKHKTTDALGNDKL